MCVCACARTRVCVCRELSCLGVSGISALSKVPTIYIIKLTCSAVTVFVKAVPKKIADCQIVKEMTI